MQLTLDYTVNYSLLRSRTFWLLAFMFVLNGWAAIAGQLHGPWVALVDFALTSMASYFHLQTGKSTSGSN